ncbi:PAS domain-containing sensor histidine kinase [Pelagicoccus mobilis]|uniref:histidine kinase n=1 Tax=Pelagicoccus mobilis TaxID=415221 RepID=A0A934RUI6_9BACT|nr:PAS domain-containing sensor histidine kinase [Pelagicoccus mobilis]MBK1877097.1 PAS domain-containing sensor histidine kinase [Pelagicoccus mobilis]
MIRVIHNPHTLKASSKREWDICLLSSISALALSNPYPTHPTREGDRPPFPGPIEANMTDQNLRLSEERLKMVLEGSELGFWDWNIETGEVKRNDRWAQMLGYSSIEEFEDNTDTWTNSIHPDDREAAWASIDDHKSGRTPVHKLEYRMLTKEGGYKWILDHAKVVQYSEDGLPLRMSGTHRDITSRKLAEEKLKNSEEALKKEVQVKNRFFSIIAHDLRTPFNSFLGATQMMSEMMSELSQEELVEYATKLNEEASRVFDYLQNLLEWSRLQIKGCKREPRIINLAELTRECIDILTPTASSKGISFTLTISDQNVFADPYMTRTVMLNLITNSLKFSTPGESITISASNKGNITHVTVSDTGIGMSEDLLKKVFSLDQPTSKTGTAGETGTGLGLPLCKEMIERNKGEIWAESALGKGSHFHFSLPNSSSES